MVLYRFLLQKKNPFFTQFLAKFLSKNFQIIISLYFFIFCNLKKIKSNSLVTVWNALGLSHQTTVSLNYSQSIKINIGPSDGGTIISSSRRPTVLNQRLTELRIRITSCRWKKKIFSSSILFSPLFHFLEGWLGYAKIGQNMF